VAKYSSTKETLYTGTGICLYGVSMSNSVGGTGGVQNPSGGWTFIPEA
jgi:hypothetical protein